MQMMNELNLILIAIAVGVVVAGSLKFIEWFDKKDGEGWNG
ncbi:MAG: hypothetical protein SOS93_04480 [Mannheimia varigena]|nr:hypothetical protein [Mannheimia varigena]